METIIQQRDSFEASNKSSRFLLVFLPTSLHPLRLHFIRTTRRMLRFSRPDVTFHTADLQKGRRTEEEERTLQVQEFSRGGHCVQGGGTSEAAAADEATLVRREAQRRSTDGGDICSIPRSSGLHQPNGFMRNPQMRRKKGARRRQIWKKSSLSSSQAEQTTSWVNRRREF